MTTFGKVRNGIGTYTLAKGDTRYRVVYRVGDKVRSKGEFIYKTDAEKFLRQQLAKVDTGEWIDPVIGRCTFKDWAEEWLNLPGKRATTIARDRNVLETHWIPALGDRGLATIRPADVRAVVGTMNERLAPRTVSTNYGVFRACINAAVDVELIGRTPCRGVKLPKRDATSDDDVRFLERAELDRLAAALPVEYAPMAYVAGVLGLRWSEVVGLRVGRINFLKRTLVVAETIAEVHGQLLSAPVKSKASRRTLAVPPFLTDMLAAHLARSGHIAEDALVFQAPDGGPLRATNFRRRVWAPAVKEADLPGLTFHGLRHTAVGFMIALGYQPGVIQKRCGHASIRTTMDVYGHLLPSADEAVAAGLNQLFAGEVADAGT